MEQAQHLHIQCISVVARDLRCMANSDKDTWPTDCRQ